MRLLNEYAKRDMQTVIDANMPYLTRSRATCWPNPAFPSSTAQSLPFTAGATNPLTDDEKSTSAAGGLNTLWAAA